MSYNEIKTEFNTQHFYKIIGNNFIHHKQILKAVENKAQQLEMDTIYGLEEDYLPLIQAVRTFAVL
jgi:hypothetical protein